MLTAISCFKVTEEPSIRRNGRLGMGTWPLLGRVEEISAIEAALAASGSGGVMLVGAPGVGKTRLAREALALAQRASRATEWVAATRAAASIPFGAVCNLLVDAGRRGTDRLAMLRATVDALAQRSRRSPLVLGVDDAHLLDDESAALIHQLAIRGLVFTVATARLGEPAPEAITAWWKDCLVVRLLVRPLSSDVVDELIGCSLGSHVDGISRQEIRNVAAGYPLVLREVLGGAMEAGGLVRSEETWRLRSDSCLGSGLIELVETWTSELSDPVKAVLEVLSYSGSLSAASLERLIHAGPLRAGAVETAERLGLVVWMKSGSRHSLRLSHPVCGEVICRMLPVSRAREIYGWLAESAEAGPLRRHDDAVRLATWQMEASAVRDPSLLINAAFSAIEQGRFAIAERLARTAHGMDAGPHADLMTAWALTWQGRHDDAARILSVLDAHENVAAETAVIRAMNLLWRSSVHSGTERALRDIASSSAGHPIATAARAWLLLYQGHCQQALASADMVRHRPGCTGEFAQAAFVTAAALIGQLQAALGDDAEMSTERSSSDDSLYITLCGWAKWLALCLAGRIRQAHALAMEQYNVAAQRVPWSLAGWATRLGVICMAQGKAATALPLLREALVVLESADPFLSRRSVLAELAGATALTGDAAAAVTLMSRSDSQSGRSQRLLEPRIELNRAWVKMAEGNLGPAGECAIHAAELAHDARQYAVEAIALYDAARLGRLDVSPRLAELSGVVDGQLVVTLANAATALLARDGDGLDKAATMFQELGLTLHAAEASAAAVRCHSAASQIRHANASRERMMALADGCECAKTPLLKADDLTVLTDRQREIATLAASGLASKVIASRLSLSVRTVDNHLAHSYAKLGVSSRAQLAAIIGAPTRAGNPA